MSMPKKRVVPVGLRKRTVHKIGVRVSRVPKAGVSGRRTVSRVKPALQEELGINHIQIPESKLSHRERRFMRKSGWKRLLGPGGRIIWVKKLPGPSEKISIAKEPFKGVRKRAYLTDEYIAGLIGRTKRGEIKAVSIREASEEIIMLSPIQKQMLKRAGWKRVVKDNREVFWFSPG